MSFAEILFGFALVAPVLAIVGGTIFHVLQLFRAGH
jgi:Flp pilus assembly protein TadG